MNIIFLDFDGVLNSANHFHLNRDSHISPTCIQFFLEAIRDINKQVETKIVISSSWRSRDINDFKEFCFTICGESNKGYMEELFTYLHDDYATKRLGKKRGYEIKEWLDRHSEVNKYLCIDDESDFLKDQSLLKTDQIYGFGLTEMIITKNFFTGENVDYVKNTLPYMIRTLEGQLRFIEEI